MSMFAVRRAAALLACAALVGCSLAPAAAPIAPATSQPPAAAGSPTPADASPTPPPQPDTVEHLVIGGLWLWDGAAAHKVDTKIRTTENSRIVLSS